MKTIVSRRRFVGHMAAAMACVSFPPALHAQNRAGIGRALDDYDGMARLASNENPYGPSPKALAAGSDVIGENLLWLAIIILAARLFAPLAQKVGFPAVLGELLLGVALGNLGLLGFHYFDACHRLNAQFGFIPATG